MVETREEAEIQKSNRINPLITSQEEQGWKREALNQAQKEKVGGATYEMEPTLSQTATERIRGTDEGPSSASQAERVVGALDELPAEGGMKKVPDELLVEVSLAERSESTRDRTHSTQQPQETHRTEEQKLLSEKDAAIAEILMRDRRVVEENGGNGSLPPELAEEAELDIHEKPEWIERDVQALREMVEAEPGLNSRLDTPFLLSFLRARKFDYDKAMSMIRSYYKARQENAEMYVNLLPSALEQVWPLKMQTVLPTPDRLGRTVIVFRTGSWMPEVCGLDEVFRSQVLILEHVVRVPVTQLRGVAAVVDCAGLSMTHAYYLTPTHIRRMISVIQEVFPLRFKALHFVNEPSIFDWVFSLIKPFLSETIKGRLHFHGEDLNSLHQHIPARDLPEELGGGGGPLDNTCLVENLRKHEEYFKDHFTYGFETCEEPARAATMMEAVSDMGSLIGSYYRRMCID